MIFESSMVLMTVLKAFLKVYVFKKQRVLVDVSGRGGGRFWFMCLKIVYMIRICAIGILMINSSVWVWLIQQRLKFFTWLKQVRDLRCNSWKCRKRNAENKGRERSNGGQWWIFHYTYCFSFNFFFPDIIKTILGSFYLIYLF